MRTTLVNGLFQRRNQRGIACRYQTLRRVSINLINMNSLKQSIIDLLMAMETGDPMAVGVINEEKYIQHNPMTRDGGKGIAELFRNISLTNPKVSIVRAFEDGDFVFAHGRYDFGSPNIVFEVFRFEGEKTTEHWDNLQAEQGPNTSGRTMLDGPTEVIDLDKTEVNRELVRRFVQTIFIKKEYDSIAEFIDNNQLIQHSPFLKDAFTSLKLALDGAEGQDFRYVKTHRVLAEGNFVLAVNEAYVNDNHCGFYDLFRVEDGKIAEHWSTIHGVAPESMWRNSNGKFSGESK